MMRGFFVLLVLALAGSHCAVVWAQEYTPQCRNAGTGKLQDCTGRLRRDQAPLVDVQRFTVVGAALWTKPVGSYQLCTTRCCGGGGGGGGGHAALGSNSGAGGAGGPGFVIVWCQ